MTTKHSAGGLIINQDKVLTISWTTHEYICFPKGGIEDSETSEFAATREVFEETGYRARIIAPIKSWTHEFDKNGEHFRETVDYYLMQLIDGGPPTPHRQLGEDFENLWLNIDEAFEKLTFDDAKEALEIAKNLLEDLRLTS
ncbi:MAG: NUDIX domain-containing protein [Microcoleus sp.]